MSLASRRSRSVASLPVTALPPTPLSALFDRGGERRPDLQPDVSSSQPQRLRDLGLVHVGADESESRERGSIPE